MTKELDKARESADKLLEVVMNNVISKDMTYKTKMDALEQNNRGRS